MSNEREQSPARRRIKELLDAGTFVEIGKEITARNTDFNLRDLAVPTDGVVTGYGLIHGDLVFVYSQDPSVLNGTIGEMHAKKIVRIYEQAIKMRAPMVGLIDCAGFRVQEATDALEAVGNIYHAQSCASGCVPQITAIFGRCGGGLSLFPGLTDFTFMEKEKASLFINAPNVLAENAAEADLGSAAYQRQPVRTVDAAGTEAEILDEIRSLIAILPLNSEEGMIYGRCLDDLNRVCTGIEKEYEDPVRVLGLLSDRNYFFETKREFAREMVTGFIRLNGVTVGAVANRMKSVDQEGNVSYFDDVLTVDGCWKAANFIRFCDAFSIPVLTLTNVSGFEASEDAQTRLSASAAELVYACSSASVPKINLITGKAFGSAYIAMNSRSLGADVVYSWPESQIGMMDANLAAKIMYSQEEASVVREKAEEYKQLQNGPHSAAKRGYVDAIIEPEETRKYLIGAIEMLFTKKWMAVDKKHGTM